MHPNLSLLLRQLRSLDSSARVFPVSGHSLVRMSGVGTLDVHPIEKQHMKVERMIIATRTSLPSLLQGSRNRRLDTPTRRRPWVESTRSWEVRTLNLYDRQPSANGNQVAHTMGPIFQFRGRG